MARSWRTATVIVAAFSAAAFLGGVCDRSLERQIESKRKLAESPRLTNEEFLARERAFLEQYEKSQRADSERMLQRRQEEEERKKARRQALLDSVIASANLSAAFASNPIRTMDQHQGRELVVEGRIVRISRGLSGEGLVYLAGASAYSAVLASFDNARDVIAVSAGQTVVVHCSDLTDVLGMLSLENCALL